MTKLEQMQMKLSQLVTDMQSKIDKDDIDGATAVRDEIKALQDKIEAQIFLDEIQNKNFKKKSPDIPVDDKTKENASCIRACIKKFAKQPLTEVENALLLPTTSAVNGANGEGYVLPQDIQLYDYSIK